MKMKLFLFLLFGVLIFLFASCGEADTEETAPESESISEVQTTEDGKVLLSTLSDEELLAFFEEQGFVLDSYFKGERLPSTMSMCREGLVAIEAGEFGPSGVMSATTFFFDLFNYAREYYGVE